MKRLEELPEHATPSRDCPKCKGLGLLPQTLGFHAGVSLCDCIHPSPCPRCGGSGRILAIMDGVERVGRCKCQILPDRARLFNAAKLPARYADATLESYEARDEATRAAKEAAEQWVHDYAAGNTRRGLLLHGEVGRGKTHLLVGVARRLTLEHNKRVRFVEFTLLLSELMEGFERGDGRQTVLAPLRDVEILAIDEIGKGRCTEFELAVLDELITQRYNTAKVILATSNYAPGMATGEKTPNLALHGRTYAPSASGAARSADPSFYDRGLRVPTLVDRVGDRVYSRLLEMVGLVAVEGGDRRQLLHQQQNQQQSPPPTAAPPPFAAPHEPALGPAYAAEPRPAEPRRGEAQLTALRVTLTSQMTPSILSSRDPKLVVQLERLLGELQDVEEGVRPERPVEELVRDVLHVAGRLGLPAANRKWGAPRS